MSEPVTVMASTPLARHWQWLSLRFRRTRRGLPSVLVIIFILAISAILFFPELDAESFATRSTTPIPSTTKTRHEGSDGDKELLLQEQPDWRDGKKEDSGSAGDEVVLDTLPVIDIESESESESESGAGVDVDPISVDDEEEDPVVQNIEKLRLRLRDNYAVDHWRSAREENDGALKRLADCLKDRSCGEGERNVVLLATFHFGHAKLGLVSGEDIWARSSLEAFTALNYTLLYTYGHMDTLLIYQHIPELVKTIIWEGEQLRRCMARNETNFEFENTDEMRHTPGTWQDDLQKGCIKTDTYPTGIPLSKSFWFHFWPTAPHPLGEKWTLAPYDYMETSKRENFFLGYSIQTACEKIPFIKNKQHRAIVLGKRPVYYLEDKFAWTDILPPISDKISPATSPGIDGEKEGGSSSKFKFVGAYPKDKAGEVIEKQGVESLGKLDMGGWFEAVGKSKVMLGIGEPYLSPSPFDALCQGVPFVNVIRHWDQKKPEDRTKWRTQHDPLLALGAPYVYHVRRGDQAGLENAIREAIDNPIDRYIPPPMTRESVIDKHRKFVETDWTSLGKTRIEVELKNEKQPFPYAA